jgi:hypothetical protein
MTIIKATQSIPIDCDGAYIIVGDLSAVFPGCEPYLPFVVTTPETVWGANIEKFETGYWFRSGDMICVEQGAKLLLKKGEKIPMGSSFDIPQSVLDTKPQQYTFNNAAADLYAVSSMLPLNVTLEPVVHHAEGDPPSTRIFDAKENTWVSAAFMEDFEHWCIYDDGPIDLIQTMYEIPGTVYNLTVDITNMQ